MDHALFTRLSQFSMLLQEGLFPRLEPETGPVTGKMELFVACCQADAGTGGRARTGLPSPGHSWPRACSGSRIRASCWMC